MHAPPRVVATDLDGTLLRSDGTVGHRTLAALDAARADGAEVLFVTGRPPRWLQPVAEVTGHRGVTICANGALVVDMATGEVVQTHPFERAVGLDVLDRLRAFDADLSFGVEWADGFAHEPTYPRGTRSSEKVRGAAETVDGPEDLFARPVIKLLARHNARSSEDLAAAVSGELADLATVTHSMDGLLELSAAGVTKAFSLRRLAERYGAAASDVIAFGDMPNDVAMLRWAGWSVAVENAHAHVLRVADEVTASNDDDGVGRVLERVFG